MGRRTPAAWLAALALAAVSLAAPPGRGPAAIAAAAARPAAAGPAAAGPAAASAADGPAAGGVQVLVDGAPVAWEPPPRLVAPGRVLAPARALAGALGADVAWEPGPGGGAVTFTRGSTTVRLRIGSREAAADGRPVLLDAAPVLDGGRALVPLRAVSTALGATVSWDPAVRAVHLVPPPAGLGVIRPPEPIFGLTDLLGLFPAGYGLDFATSRLRAPDGRLLGAVESDRLWSALLQHRLGRALLLLAGTLASGTGFDPLPRITPAPRRTTHPVPGRDGLVADLYLPAAAGPHPGLLLYSPLAGGGKDDPDLVHQAETMARLGYAVLVPMRATTTLASPDDIDDVAAAAAFLLAQPAADPQRLSFLCISYGAGPCLGAAARPQWRDRVQTIATMGGYAYVENLLALAVTGRHPAPAAGAFIADPYVQDVLRDSLSGWARSDPALAPLAALADAADPAGRADPVEFVAGYAALPPAVRTRFDALSPALALRRWPGRLLIIHSTHDPYIPHLESELLYRAAPPGQARLAVVTLFEHARVREADWPALLRDHAGELLSLLGVALEMVP